MKAITTRYHGPTDTRGSRISATDGDNRISIPYPYELNTDAGHRKAALALCNKLKWSKCDTLISGGLKTGNVYVFLPDNCKCTGPLEGRRSRRRGRK
jgi:hypothetical protein